MYKIYLCSSLNASHAITSSNKSDVKELTNIPGLQMIWKKILQPNYFILNVLLFNRQSILLFVFFTDKREVDVIDDQSTKPTETDRQETIASQNSFYPSFAPYENFHPLGHSRPYYFNQQQEGAYSQRSEPFQQVFDAPEK